jgi:hypothetical protein
MERQGTGNDLARAGKHKEALDEYLWCFDHGLKHNPAYYGVRLSFLLMYIKDLGETYPPAIQALRQRRDAAEKAILSGRGTPQQAHDFVALCEALGDVPRALAALDKLKNAGPDQAPVRELLSRALIAPLLQAKRYKEIVAAFRDPRDSARLD